MSEHTPIPWRVEFRDGEYGREPLVVFPDGEDASVLTEANARFIVTAVNAHDDLLAALEAVSDDAHVEHAKGWTDVPMHCQHAKCVMVRAAIAKATGETA